jgi:hypothetical protein
MRCDEFERVLQRRADGVTAPTDDRALREHASECAPCRELQDGFRLFLSAVAQDQLPRVSSDLSRRIIASTAPRRRVPWRTIGLLAAAAVVAAVGLRLREYSSRDLGLPPVADRSPQHGAAASDALFPELSGAEAADSRQLLALADAVAPVSRLVRELGKSLSGPVRPIAVSTSEAMESLIREIPDVDSSAIPIPLFRDVMMPSPMKKMDGMAPSS